MKNRSLYKGRAREVGLFTLFVVPAVIIWFSVIILPFLYGIGITFTDWNGLSMDIHFIGLQNYKEVFSDAAFLQSLSKTILYVLFSVTLSNLIGFVLALAVTEGIKGQTLFRIGFFTPNIIGGIILGYIWNFIFSYALTGLGKELHISFLSKSWLTDPTRALIALIIVTAWQMSGYLMVIYIAGLVAVPRELLEAASIDGASSWQTVWNVKMPLIKSSITICVFLAIIRSFMSFDMNLALTAGGPYKSTELIAYKIYQTAFTSMNFGVGQAQALVLFVIVAVISLLQVYLTRRGGCGRMNKKKAKSTITFILLLLVLILFMVPFMVLIINTFKSTSEFTKMPFSLPKSIHFDNYKRAIEKMNFFVALRNTALITIAATLFNTLIASMTGYFFARKKWKINQIIFMLFLTSMVAPFQVYMIPLVQIYGGTLGLSNNLMMVAYIAVGLNIPFAVFLYNGFASGIPVELDEAAKIDGCGFTRIFFTIILPLLKPIMITVMVFVALGVWNDYLMSSLFLTKSETKTLAIAAFAFLTNHTADYSPMMAGLVLGIIPVLLFYFIGQKYIIEGVIAGSVKG